MSRKGCLETCSYLSRKRGYSATPEREQKLIESGRIKLHRVILIFLLAMESFLFCFSDALREKRGTDEQSKEGFRKGIVSASVQYNNYSGNRYPGHKKSPDTGSFKDGAITISWSWMW